MTARATAHADRLHLRWATLPPPALLLIIGWVALLGACGDLDEDPYRAPVLADLDWTDLVTVMGDLEASSVEREGRFEAARFQAYRYPAPGGAHVRVDLERLSGSADPVLVLYGPRAESGAWGSPRAVDDDGGVGSNARIEGRALDRGAYLLVVTARDWPASGAYRLRVSCLEGCEAAPVCPLPPNCGSAICFSGYVADADGCPTCECRDECRGDAQCGPENRCVRGQCVSRCPCLDAFEPVCGADGRTYSSPCEAACLGVDVLSRGACRDDCPTLTCDVECAAGYARDADGCPTCECLDPCAACDRQPAPVCTVNGATFLNRCRARCEGEVVAYEGACIAECEPLVCDLSCPGGLARDDAGCPVCECLGAVCPATDEPVCGTNGVTYRNACTAEANGVSVLFEGPCPPLCGSVDECPVGFACVSGGEQGLPACDPSTVDGASCPSVCVARSRRCDSIADCLAGDVCTRDGVCLSPCDCHPVYQPVCDEAGRTWDNVCRARCAGVAIADWGPCCPELSTSACDLECPGGFAIDDDGCETCACAERDECVCDAVDNPVCGQDGQRYDNPCEMRCAGVAASADPGRCGPGPGGG